MSVTADGADDLLLSEIGEQPAVLERLLKDPVRTRILEIGRALFDPMPPVAVLAARGTSDHAAVLMKYLLETRLGLPVSLAAPSVVTLYRRSPSLAHSVVIAVSQSGRSPDLVAVLEHARSAGARTLAVVNDVESPLARAADHVLDVGAGPERSVAATKSFSAQLLTLGLVVLGAESPDRDEAKRRALAEFGSVPGAVGEVLGARILAAIEGMARRLANYDRVFVTGRGYQYPIALEIALKLKEMAGVLGEGYSAADLRHGPIALAGPEMPVLAVGGRGPTETDLDALLTAARRLQSPLATLTDAEDLVKHADMSVLVPEVPELAAPLVTAVAGQRLAFAWARARGLHPGSPPAIHKVTETL